MFNWLFGKRRSHSQPQQIGPRPLEEDLEDLRRTLRQQGMPEQGIDKVCNDLREEVEIMARRQQQEAREGTGPGGPGKGEQPGEPAPDAPPAAEQDDDTNNR